MPSHATPCYVVVINQEQEKVRQHLKSCESIDPVCLTVPKRCTVVENGRVVVKSLPSAQTSQ